nr:CRISPR-associated primase-polymerase type B [Bacteroides sp. UBA939]
MLLVGTNITSAADALKKVTVEYLYHSFRNPKPEISAKIRQLRIVRRLDVKQYAALKRMLPYVVCGMFNPPYRRTENFAFIEYFMVDIDHLTEKGLDIADVRKRIEQDERVALCFLSPGEDGLKVLFRLKERCYDAGLYSLFYKAFVRKFSIHYQLEQVVDARTCDVCRACFVSIDPDVYYSPDSTPVDINEYIDTSDITGMMDMKASFAKEEKEQAGNGKEEMQSSDPDADVLARIKEVLHPKAAKRGKEKPPVYVPEQLDELMDGLRKYIEDTGTSIYEVINIQYGKKLRMKVGLRQAEINLFYGKRGFSVVQSPRCGTSSELNQLMADLITSFLNENT